MIFIVLLFLGSTVLAVQAQPALLAASPLSTPITLDGKLDDPAWRECVAVEDLLVAGGTENTDDHTSFRAGYRDGVLYLGVTCTTKSKPKAKPRPRDDAAVFGDDSIEVYLAPAAGGAVYYQLVANADGSQYDGQGVDKAWNGDWQVKTALTVNGWTMEFAIPLATIGVTAVVGAELGFNLCRNDISAGGQWQTWAQLPAGGYHQPQHFGRLRLGAQPIGLTGLALMRTPEGAAVVRAVAVNAGAQPVKLAADLQLTSPAGTFQPHVEAAIAPGKTGPLTLTAPDALRQPGAVAASLSVLADGQVLYRSPVRSLAVATIPVAATTARLVVLANAQVRFEFDEFSGGLVAIRNQATGAELRPRADALPVFTLEAVPFRTNPLFFREEDVQHLQPDATTCRECRRSGNELRQRHVFPGGVEVTVTVTLPPDQGLSQWRIRVNNDGAARPSTALVVQRVAFPQLRGLRAAETDAQQVLALPQLCGLLAPSPVANLPKLPSYQLAVQSGSEQSFQNGRYTVTWASMWWLDLSGPRGGVSLACHDHDPVYDTMIEAANDQAHAEMELTIRRWSLCWPNQVWEPGACVVGVHAGDWHWSADRYHEWFYATFKPRPTPPWLRECSGWNGSGGGNLTYTWNDLPAAARRGKPFGLDYIQKWCNTTGGDQGYAAFPFPNPYAGPLSDFKHALAEIHKLGGHLGFYHNLTSGDPMLGRYLRQPRLQQKIPPTIPRPAANPLANGWLAACKLQSDGAWWTGGGEPCYLDGYWWNCWGAKGWMDFCYDWYVNRWRKEYGLDAAYLDSTGPGVAACFNTHHGHAQPHGQEQFLLEFYQRLATGSDPDYAICQEFVWDRLMVHGTHSLATFTFGTGPFSEPALFRYTHPDFPLFCGCANFFGGGDKDLLGVLPTATWPEFLGYVFLYGARFDHFVVPDSTTPAEWRAPQEQEEIDLLFLRHALHEDLNGRADFRDRIGLGALPEKVFARVFIRKDGRGVLVTLFDLRAKRAPFALTLDLKPHRLRNVTAAELVVGGGKTEPLATPPLDDRVATLSLPALPGKTAAIRFTTTR